MKYFFTVIAIFWLFACNNSADSPAKSSDDTLKNEKPVIAALSGPPPAKVTGIFAGELPCADCEKIGVLLTLTETGYEKTQHKVAPKKKNDLLSSIKGSCVQDSGLITLYNAAGKPSEKYRIKSGDSIEYLGSKGKGVNGQKQSFLIRKDGVKIVQ